MYEDDTLQHYGVLGMHWGHRRGSISRSIKARKKAAKAKKEAERARQEAALSKEHKEKMRIKSKKISEMSNAELKTVNERLQLEKKYKELATEDLSRGQKFVRDMLLNSAKQTAQQQTSKYMSKATEAAIAKVLTM